LLEIAERVKAKGADLCILNLGDTGTATGHLMFTVIGAIACFERELMLERQLRDVPFTKTEITLLATGYRGWKPAFAAECTGPLEPE
jgi:hypothetical protein